MKIQPAIFVFSLLFCSFFAIGQGKEFLDANQKVTDKGSAYYYRTVENIGDTIKLDVYYVSNDAVFFTGGCSKLDPEGNENNQYIGLCTWYHRNGRKKRVQRFDKDGAPIEETSYYFENGKLARVVNEDNNSVYTEYDEDGYPTTVFHEHFDKNSGHWELFSSEFSEAKLVDGKLLLSSLKLNGTSRYLYHEISSDEFSIETTFSPVDEETAFPTRYGMIYDFKNWNNYSYFFIEGRMFSIGGVLEGISSIQARDMLTVSINEDGEENRVKIVFTDENTYYSINGKVVMKTASRRLRSSNFGVVLAGKGAMKVDDFIIKQFGNSASSEFDDKTAKGSGTGFVITNNGYVMTNHHVIEDANEIVIEFTQGPFSSYGNLKCEVVLKDEAGDMAVLKITDEKFQSTYQLPYVLKSDVLAVGTAVYSLGYPMALSGLGREVKFSEGSISSKTGYENSINSYQTSVPVQPGNSGSPLVDAEGNIVGCIHAIIREADNVSYAVKATTLINLLGSVSGEIAFSSENRLKELKREDQIKELSKYVGIIKTR